MLHHAVGVVGLAAVDEDTEKNDLKWSVIELSLELKFKLDDDGLSH